LLHNTHGADLGKRINGKLSTVLAMARKYLYFGYGRGDYSSINTKLAFGGTNRIWALARSGFNTLVDLRNQNTKGEEIEATKYHLNYFNFPTPDGGAPSVPSLEEIVKTISRVTSWPQGLEAYSQHLKLDPKSENYLKSNLSGKFVGSI
jgi:hypothetical protein